MEVQQKEDEVDEMSVPEKREEDEVDEVTVPEQPTVIFSYTTELDFWFLNYNYYFKSVFFRYTLQLSIIVCNTFSLALLGGDVNL